MKKKNGSEMKEKTPKNNNLNRKQWGESCELFAIPNINHFHEREHEIS